MWISPKFKLLLIKEFEILKTEEKKQLGWNAKRELSKINYRIHTDAIKQNLIPNELTKEQINYVYTEEADVLNMAIFGMTAKEWKNKNKNLDGNIRDHATIIQDFVDKQIDYKLDTEKQDNYDINHQIAINSVIRQMEETRKNPINKRR